MTILKNSEVIERFLVISMASVLHFHFIHSYPVSR